MKTFLQSDGVEGRLLPAIEPKCIHSYLDTDALSIELIQHFVALLSKIDTVCKPFLFCRTLLCIKVVLIFKKSQIIPRSYLVFTTDAAIHTGMKLFFKACQQGSEDGSRTRLYELEIKITESDAYFAQHI